MQGTTIMHNQQQPGTTSMAANTNVSRIFRLTSLAAAASISVILTGCGLAPGMHMEKPAALAAPAATPEDIVLLREIRDSLKNSNASPKN